MKRAFATLAMIFSGLAAPAHADDALSFDKFRLTPTVSTLGIGLEGSYRWNERWGARAGINGLGVHYTYHDKDSDLINDLMLLNAGATADYYPFEGDFRISAGVRLSANKIEGDVHNLKKHDKNTTIIIADPQVRYKVEQNVVQPYLGIGYTAEINKRVSLAFDFGALYAGAPSLDARWTRETLVWFTRDEIRNEVQRQRDRIAPFQVYPVVQVGLTVRF